MIELLISLTLLFFLCVVIIGHPILVAGIISQIETPFVIRIGLVTMTYAIPFAIFWFCSDTSDEPKKEKESSDRNNIFLILLTLMLMIFHGFETWQELQLRHQLLEEGVSAVATVQKCEKKKGSRGASYCYMSYDYEVPFANTTKLYTVREEINCSKVCEIGHSVDISYLPQSPTEAGIIGNRDFLKSDIIIVALFLDIIILYLFFNKITRFIMLYTSIIFFVLSDFFSYLIQKWKRSLKRGDES